MANSNKKRMLVAATLGVVVCGAGLLAYRSPLGDAVLGISTIVVANDSGAELSDVRIVLFTSQLPKITREFPRMRTGAREVFRHRTSDFYVDRMDFVLNGSQKSYIDGGVSTPGEVFVLSIGADGNVKTHYAKRKFISFGPR